MIAAEIYFHSAETIFLCWHYVNSAEYIARSKVYSVITILIVIS